MSINVYYQVKGRPNANSVEVAQGGNLIDLRKAIVKESKLACSADELVLKVKGEGDEQHTPLSDDLFEEQYHDNLSVLISAFNIRRKNPIQVTIQLTISGTYFFSTRYNT